MPFFEGDHVTDAAIIPRERLEKLEARVAELEAERDRLREALESIMRHQHLVAGEFGAKTAVHEIARAALAGKQPQEGE